MNAPDFHSTAPAHVAGARVRYADERFHQLDRLTTESAEGAWQYLLAVNGGGSATALAFIGAVPSLRGLAWPFWVLGLFVAGLVATGLGRAVVVHRASLLLEGWRADTLAYFEGRIGWQHVHLNDNARLNRLPWLPWTLGWIAFFAFLAGVITCAVYLRVGQLP